LKLDPSAFVADKDLFEALEKRATLVRCEEDKVLFRQGDMPMALYLLRSGCVKMTMTALNGETLVSMTTSQGALLGLPGFIGNQPYTLTAQASKGAELGFISRADFSELMLTNPALSLKVLSVLAAEVRNARAAMSHR
jgi:CRP-like cAMP-binding protein